MPSNNQQWSYIASQRQPAIAFSSSMVLELLAFLTNHQIDILVCTFSYMVTNDLNVCRTKRKKLRSLFVLLSLGVILKEFCQRNDRIRWRCLIIADIQRLSVVIKEENAVRMLPVFSAYKPKAGKPHTYYSRGQRSVLWLARFSRSGRK